MMDKEFLDKVLDQAIEEASTIYVEKDELENRVIEDENIEFSDLHKEKMKKLFKEVRKEDNRRKAVRLTKKVAIVILCTLLVTCGLITTVEAWREQVIKFIMQNNDNNYMSINFGNASEEIASGDEQEIDETKEINQYIADEIKFLYVPEGFKFVQEKPLEHVKHFNFKNEESYILLKKEEMRENYGKQADVENAVGEKIKFNDKEVFKIIKNDTRVAFVWYDDINTYTVMSNMPEVEIHKFIENIKILKNF